MKTKTPTDKHQELTKKIIETLLDFHKNNPDLFVEDIQIYSREIGEGRKILNDIDITIIVQPHK